MDKPKEALYTEYDRKLNKWRLVGASSETVFGLFDTKKEANEYFIELMKDNDKAPSKRKANKAS